MDIIINYIEIIGSDRTTLRISDTNDEITKHIQGRYIGPSEAFARIFEYSMHEEDPTVTTLALHLPNEQPVFFDENISEADLRLQMDASQSKLMAYFAYYRNNSGAAPILYQDFPAHFVWEDKAWKIREKGIINLSIIDNSLLTK